MIIEAFISVALVWLISNFSITYVERRKMPPGPFPLPLIGNILEMINQSHNPFKKFTEKYGDIFTFYLPTGAVVVLNNASLIREARIGKRDDIMGRCKVHLYPFTEIFGDKDLIMSDYSPAYLFRRRVFKSAMHVFGGGIENAEGRARHAVKLAIREIEVKTGQPFCPMELITGAIVAQLWQWLSSKNEPLNSPTINTLRELLEIVEELALPGKYYQLLPFIRYFPTQFGRKIERGKKIVNTLLIPEFRKHQETYTPGVARDLTDGFINAYEKEIAKEKGKDIGSAEDIPGIMLDVIFGGSDTTSTSLSWLVLYMVLHEDVQRKVHEEIDTVIGKERLPQLRDAQNMPYLQSTLCEVERISGIVPITGTSAIRDTIIAGYHIPKGTFVLLNLRQAHRDRREWPEANQFRPERFLDEDGKFVGWTKVNGFVPFGVGRRECPGSSLAKIMLFIFSSTLLQRYKVELPEQSEAPSTEVFFTPAVSRPQKFKVIAKERD